MFAFVSLGAMLCIGKMNIFHGMYRLAKINPLTIKNKPEERKVMHSGQPIKMTILIQNELLMFEICPVPDIYDTSTELEYKVSILNQNGNECQKKKGKTTLPYGFMIPIEIMKCSDPSNLLKYCDREGHLQFSCDLYIKRNPSTEAMIRSLYIQNNTATVNDILEENSRLHTQLSEFLANRTGIEESQSENRKPSEKQEERKSDAELLADILSKMDINGLHELSANISERIKALSMCKVCLDKIPDAIIIPCCHSFCNECISRVTLCPVCRGSIQERRKMYV